MQRIRRVLERIVRGLYYAERRIPLGLDNEVRVYSDEDLAAQPPDVLEELTRTILRPLAAQAPVTIGGDVFVYRFHVHPSEPVFSVWCLTFYAAVSFFCQTRPSSNADSEDVRLTSRST